MKAEIIKTEWSYIQEADSGGPGDALFFTIKTCDNGVANYMVIETERWAIDDENLEEFIEEIRAKWEQIKSNNHKL